MSGPKHQPKTDLTTIYEPAFEGLQFLPMFWVGSDSQEEK